jgi:hypothetical protein
MHVKLVQVVTFLIRTAHVRNLAVTRSVPIAHFPQALHTNAVMVPKSCDSCFIPHPSHDLTLYRKLLTALVGELQSANI